jgi:hypothetical protein
VTKALRASLVIVGGSGILFLFLTRFAPALLLLRETLPPVLGASVVLLACFGAGSVAIPIAAWIFRNVALAEDRQGQERGALDALIVGVPFFGTLIAVVALIGIALPVAVITLTIVFAILGAWRLGTARPSNGSLCVFAHPLLVPPILLAAIEAITPVNSPDELIYKLAVPKAWLMYGKMIELPLASNSYYVAAARTGDLAALVLAGGVAAKLVHFGIYLAALAMLERLARRLGAVSPVWVAAVFAWTPALMLVAGWAWDDWVLIALFALSLDRWEAWKAATSDPEVATSGNATDLAICFAALGGAVASKYTALFWLLIFFAIVTVTMRRKPRFVVAAAIVIALFGGLFYVRNLVWTGSPVAPMLLAQSPTVHHHDSTGFLSGWNQLGDYVIEPGLVDEALGVLLPFSILAAVFAVRRRRMAHILILGLVQTLILVTIGPGARLLISGVMPLAVCGAVVMTEVWAEMGGRWRVLLGIAAGIAIAGHAVLVLFVVDSYDWLPYLGGQKSAHQYLELTRPFMRPYDWIAAHTPVESRILLLGETRAYYLQRQAVWGTNFDGPRIASWLGQSHSPDELQRSIWKSGITHIILHKPWYRIEGPGVPPANMLEREYLLDVSPDTDALVTAFLKTRAVLRYRDAEYLIFEVMTQTKGAPSAPR